METLQHFFGLADLWELERLLFNNELISFNLYPPNDPDVIVDKKKSPDQRIFSEIEITEIPKPDYRSFKEFKYLQKRIIVLERHQLHNLETTNNVISSSLRIYPLGKGSIKHIKKKKQNFLMGQINFFRPQGAILITKAWEKILEATSKTYFHNYDEQEIKGEKILIEKIGPISTRLSTLNDLFNPDCVKRCFSPFDWMQIISKDIPVCEVTPLKPEIVENDPYLRHIAVRTKIHRIPEEMEIGIA